MILGQLAIHMENRKSKSWLTIIKVKETPAALKITCENQNHKAVGRQYREAAPQSWCGERFIREKRVQDY